MTRAAPQTRYSLVNGCYSLRLASGRQLGPTLGGRPVLADMFYGAEAYLEMWERAFGVPATSCRPASAGFAAQGVGPLALGESSQSALYRAGQPVSRPGRSYQYCLGRSGHKLAAVFDARGRLAMLLSSAPGYRARGIHPGSSAASVSRLGRSLGDGLWLGRRLPHGSRFVYGVRRASVTYVGVVSASGARSPQLVRSDVRAAGLS